MPGQVQTPGGIKAVTSRGQVEGAADLVACARAMCPLSAVESACAGYERQFAASRTIYLPTVGRLGTYGFELLATAQRPASLCA